MQTVSKVWRVPGSVFYNCGIVLRHRDMKKTGSIGQSCIECKDVVHFPWRRLTVWLPMTIDLAAHAATEVF